MTRGRNRPAADVEPTADRSVSECFEWQVAHGPDQIAVKTMTEAITYAALNEAANRVAHAVLDRIGADSAPVALMYEQGWHGLAAMLGVLKAGKTYVPLDPAYPPARTTYMLEHSEAGLVLTHDPHAALAQDLARGRVAVLPTDRLDAAVSGGNVGVSQALNATAYILYTSGSTGQPKGVIQTQRNLLHFVRSYSRKLQIAAADRLTLFYSFSFSASLMDIYGALLHGATLFPYNVKERGVADLADWLNNEEITVYHSVPTVFRHFVSSLTAAPEFPRLRIIDLGGEPVYRQDVELFKKHFRPPCVLVNHLAFTEASVAAQFVINHETEVDEPHAPAGFDADGVEILLHDEDGRAVAPGAVGEMIVKSGFVSPGYWRDPALTRAAFSLSGDYDGERLYRTGDLGRRLGDGRLEHVGRKDFRLKIRGHSIEVAEIEQALLQLESVRETVVIGREDEPGAPTLVAYVVPRTNPPPSVSALRNHLAQLLPDFMWPTAFVLLDTMPLTATGKLDRRSLPAPELGRRKLATAYVAPRTPIEELVAAIWQDVLQIDRVGVHDDFFELGGHSLLATRVVSRVRDFVQLDLPVRRLFERPTIAALALNIQAACSTPHSAETPRIIPVARHAELPLSFSQQRLWFFNQLEPNNTAYNIPAALHLSGQLNVSALEQSFKEIVRRHEVLRTTFTTEHERPVQVIAPSRSRVLERVDLSELPQTEREAEVQRLAVVEACRPFDLERGPLFRSTAVQLGREEHVLFLTMHHIVSDGWSHGVFLRELAALYGAFATGQPSPLPELPVQYADFAVWQREWLQGEVLASQLDYWTRQLDGAPHVLELPSDRPRPAVQTFRGARQRLDLPKDLADGLTALCRREQVTQFMTLLAAFQTLLYRITGQEDILVSCPIANRNRVEIEGLIGFFVNMLVLRANFSGSQTFRGLLTQVREAALAAYAHQDLPFDKLVEVLRPKRDLSRTPLVQVCFNMLNFSGDEVRFPGLVCRHLSLETSSKFDLTLYARERPEGMQFNLVYNADLFDQTRMAELLAQFQLLLSQLVEHPERSITDYSLITSQARQLLPDPTRVLEASWAGAAHDRFSEQAGRVPGRVAVVDKDDAWSYQELDARSNQLAHYLRASGIKPGEVVAIYGHRSASVVWALLGVLKAGAAFLILDPSYPALRLIECLRVARPRGWLQIEAAGVLPDDLERFVLELACDCRMQIPQRFSAAARGLLSEYSTAPSDVAVAPDDLAYVAFTSGSTGGPKGILGEHKSLSHFLEWHSRTFGFSDFDRFSMLSGLSHDPLLRDIFTPLWLGATLCIPDPEALLSPDELVEWMRQAEISVAHLTPALGQLLRATASDAGSAGGPARKLKALRYAFFGGDRLTQADVIGMRELAAAATCVNFYGATETPQAIAYFVVRSTADTLGRSAAARGDQALDVIPLGQGIQDVQLLVLNRAGQLSGFGEVGEIYVRTPHLAKGYLNEPALTQNRFPLNRWTGAAGDRLYKTGDRGRYRPDGNVEFLGRLDHQVKIRGLRIELGEVEAVLGQHAAVRETVVVTREDVLGDKRLVAYVVPLSKPAPEISELRGFLKQRLPDSMLPSAFVLLDTLPRSPNGKIDRRALPAPDPMRPELENGYVAPRTPIEESLVRIWSEVLGLERIGIHDNFFELGGHSLLATRVVSRVRTEFRSELPLRSLFESPTVAGLALALVKDCAEKVTPEELARAWHELDQPFV